MQLGLLIVSLVCGLATVLFIVFGLRRAFVRNSTLGMRALLLTTLFSVLTGVFTIWQLVLVVQQLGIGQ